MRAHFLRTSCVAPTAETDLDDRFVAIPSNGCCTVLRVTCLPFRKVARYATLAATALTSLAQRTNQAGRGNASGVPGAIAGLLRKSKSSPEARLTQRANSARRQ